MKHLVETCSVEKCKNRRRATDFLELEKEMTFRVELHERFLLYVYESVNAGDGFNTPETRLPSLGSLVCNW